MAMSSLLIKFNGFGLAEWVVLGILAVVAGFTFVKGYKKGFVNLKLRTLSWAFGCAAFLLLDGLFSSKNIIGALLAKASLQFKQPEVASCISTFVALLAALLLRWIIFGCVHIVSSQYKARLLKKAANIARMEKETGEEYLPDENKVYKPLPIDGVIKCGPLGRLLGGFCHMLTGLAIAATVVAVSLLLIGKTPLAAKLMPNVDGGLGKVWVLMQKYALDIVILTISGAIIIKGYKDGILNGINTVGLSIVKLVAVVGAMYIPFSAFALPGAMFGFLSAGATNLAAKIPLPIPANISVILVKVGFSIVLAIVAVIFVKLLGWACSKLLDCVDDHPALWRVDGFIGAIIYVIIMIAVIALIIFTLYLMNFFGSSSISVMAAENSSIIGGAFKLLDGTVKTTLELVRAIFTPAA